MNIQLRSISLEDANTVRLLSKQLGYQISLEDTAANIKEVLASKTHLALLAIEDAEVIGWVHAYKTTTLESKPFIELAGLVVDEKYRNKGVGKLLVDAVKAWCVEQNVFTLRVRSNVKRNDAHRFYLKGGFNEIKEQKVFQMEL